MLLGTLIVAALVGLGWLDARSASAGLWLMPVAVAFTVLATQEVLRLARAGDLRPLAWTVYLGNLLIVLGGWFSTGGGPFWALAVGLLLVFVGEMRRYEKPDRVLANIAAAVFALVYVGVMLAFAVRIRLDWGLAAMGAWIISVKMGDIGAYTVGRLIGRHKMAPTISPGKTWEGAGGALVFSCLGAWACFTWLLPAADHRPAWGWLPLGLLMGGVGMVGDLAEALLKRDAGLKDSSSWMPGFGGVLDILDSLLLSAPVAWLCWAWGMG